MRHDLLDEVDVFHEADQVVGEELNGRDGAHATRIEGRWMDVASLHQAEHLTGQAAHLQRFAVDLAGKRVEGPHDVGDGFISVDIGVRSGRFFGFRQHARVGFLHHLLAEVDEDQVVLEDAVVEHVLGGFTQIDDPLGQRRGFTPYAMFCA